LADYWLLNACDFCCYTTWKNINHKNERFFMDSSEICEWLWKEPVRSRL